MIVSKNLELFDTINDISSSLNGRYFDPIIPPSELKEKLRKALRERLPYWGTEIHPAIKSVLNPRPTNGGNSFFLQCFPPRNKNEPPTKGYLVEFLVDNEQVIIKTFYYFDQHESKFCTVSIDTNEKIEWKKIFNRTDLLEDFTPLFTKGFSEVFREIINAEKSEK